MIHWKNLSINAKIALCLLYAEQMIPKIKIMIDSCNESEKYSQGGKQMDDILDLAWKHLSDKNNADWSEMYYLSHEGHGWTNDTKYGLCGYFDFVLQLNCSEDQDSITVSNMLIYGVYYAMYHFAKRQNDTIPQDMEWFDMEGSEAEIFSCIEKGAERFLPLEKYKELEKLQEKWYKLHPFDENDPYGKCIDKKEILELI
ncbi:hypothetical protein ACYULU_02255 [Breznakiellaceae bacterium SP9]